MANSSTNFFAATTSLAIATGTAKAGLIVAQTPTISGNGWVALGIIGGFAAVVYFLIMGALHVERRDARLGRHPDGGHGWFAWRDDDDDDHHQPNDGQSN